MTARIIDFLEFKKKTESILDRSELTLIARCSNCTRSLPYGEFFQYFKDVKLCCKTCALEWYDK